MALEVLERTSIQTTTLGEILGRDEPGPSNLLQTPSQLKYWDLGRTTLFSLSLDRVFLGQDLINVLAEATPGYSPSHQFFRSSQHRNAVLADWTIVDHPNEANHPYLLRLHALLGQPWSEFNSYHRKALIAAVSGVSASEYTESFRHIALSIFTPEYMVNNLEKVYGILSHLYSEERYLTHLFELPYKKNMSDTIARNTEILSEIPLEERRKRIRPVINQMGVNIIDPDSHKEFEIGTCIAGLWMPLVDYNLKHQPHGCIEIRIGDSSMKLQVSDSGTEIIEQIIKADESVGLKPKLIWGRDNLTGKRKFYASHFPEVVQDDLGSQDNPLLGLVAAVALSDEQRRKLPKSRGIYRIPRLSWLSHFLWGKKQQMNAAQIPLLVSMYRNMILKSFLFDAVEDYMDARKIHPLGRLLSLVA